MRMRSFDIRGLATTIRTHRSVWGTVLLALLLLALSPRGFTQEQGAALKLPKGVESLDLPYLGDKGVMEKLSKAPSGLITNVTTSQEGKNLVVAVSSSCQPAYQEFNLSNPSRLVVDFLNVENRASVQNYPIAAAGVKQLRIRQFQSTDPKIARLVFDLDKSYGSHEIAADSQGVRITFHPGAGPAAEAPKTAAPAPAPTTLSADSGSKRPVAPEGLKAPAPTPASTAANVDPSSRRPAAPQKLEQTPAIAAQPPDTLPAVIPVISDLSASEIPQSALASASSQPSDIPASPHLSAYQLWSRRQARFTRPLSAQMGAAIHGTPIQNAAAEHAGGRARSTPAAFAMRCVQVVTRLR